MSVRLRRVWAERLAKQANHDAKKPNPQEPDKIR